MWDMHDGFGWWMVLGSMWFIVFWGLIIWAVVSLTSRSETRGSADGRGAIEIAKQRYARGEIGREEFEQLKRDLG